jgi:maltose O-acetyltransferase
MKLIALSARILNGIRTRVRIHVLKISACLLGSKYLIGPGSLALRPLQLKGLGTIEIGGMNSFGYPDAIKFGAGECMLQARTPTAKLKIGSRNSFSNNVNIIATQSIVIGDDCLIGDAVSIYDSDFHEIDPMQRRYGQGVSKPVDIGNNVWIGSRSVILKGVSIGDNSIVAAMSLVNKSIPANSIVGGNPAKFIRYLNGQ